MVSIMLQNTQLISGHESNSGPLKPVTRNIVLESVYLLQSSSIIVTIFSFKVIPEHLSYDVMYSGFFDT